MKRLIAVLAIAVMSACLVATGAAVASVPAAHDDDTSTLGQHLRFRTVTWFSQGAAMRVMAPRGWPLVLTPEGQARFNANGRPDVLTMSYRGDGNLSPQLRSKVAALRGTPGLDVLMASGHGRGDTASGGLRYTWTPEGGETRFVAYRYQGNDAYMVAGPLRDQRGLEAVLRTATLTGECS